MSATTPQQYRTIAIATRVMAALVFVIAVAVLVIRWALGLPVSTMIPPALLLCISGAGLLVVSGGAKKKADEMEATR